MTKIKDLIKKLETMNPDANIILWSSKDCKMGDIMIYVNPHTDNQKNIDYVSSSITKCPNCNTIWNFQKNTIENIIKECIK